MLVSRGKIKRSFSVRFAVFVVFNLRSTMHLASYDA